MHEKSYIFWNVEVRVQPLDCSTTYKAGRTLRRSLVRWLEATHQELLRSINLNAPANVGTQGELTHFVRRVTSRQSVVLLQISHWSRQFPARPAQKKWCRVIIYVQEHTIQELVLNWFSWNSHAWYGSTHEWTLSFLETIGPVEPPIWRKMYSQNQFFGFHSAGMEFFMEKTYKQYLVPHSPLKRFNSFLLYGCFASKMVMSTRKLFFAVILENMFFRFFFFWENCLMKNI